MGEMKQLPTAERTQIGGGILQGLVEYMELETSDAQVYFYAHRRDADKYPQKVVQPLYAVRSKSDSIGLFSQMQSAVYDGIAKHMLISAEEPLGPNTPALVTFDDFKEGSFHVIETTVQRMNDAFKHPMSHIVEVARAA